MELKEADRISKIDIDEVVGRLFKRKPRLDENDYAFFLLERLEEDLADAFAYPEIWEECVMSAKDRIHSIKKYLRGET
jgi:hypothetical protein